MKLSRISLTLLLLATLRTLSEAQPFTRADSLLGSLNPERSCYDVTSYYLDITFNPEDKTIEGQVDIFFTAMANFDRMQVDLDKRLTITGILFREKPLLFDREFRAVHIYMPGKILRGEAGKISVAFKGKPREALNPPWDGGFSWEHYNEKPWFSVSCEGEGASLWWPCKDHFSDEPDSVIMDWTVPDGLVAVGNGRLRESVSRDSGWTTWTWAVTNPINLYNVNITAGPLVHWSDTFRGKEGPLALDYYVLEGHEAKSREHFRQVKPMLACYEKYFGPYPFYADSYKLVETPYLGMEHQSSIAYGNSFRKGYMGLDQSGLGFDYIIIHESGHEWFGNSLTAADPAELWIHESFTTYAEAVYIECMADYETAIRYLNTQRWMIRNRHPIVGPGGVHFKGWNYDNDLYYKGAWMLQTLRTILDNDTLWWNTLYDFCTEFRHRILSTGEVITFFENRTGRELGPVFRQYLYHAEPPELMYTVRKKGNALEMEFRWEAAEPGFEMPVRIVYDEKESRWIKPTAKWQKIKLKGWKNPAKLAMDSRHMYFLETKM